MLHEKKGELFSIATPVDALVLCNSFPGDNPIRFRKVAGIDSYPPTKINIQGCTFRHPAQMKLVSNSAPQKSIELRAAGNTILHKGFKAVADAGPRSIDARTDLPGLESTAAPTCSAVEKDQRLQSAGKSWRIDVSSSTDASLPRVLLVGDSILNGYLGPIRKMLEGRFYVDAYAQSQEVNATGK